MSPEETSLSQGPYEPGLPASSRIYQPLEMISTDDLRLLAAYYVLVGNDIRLVRNSYRRRKLALLNKQFDADFFKLLFRKFNIVNFKHADMHAKDNKIKNNNNDHHHHNSPKSDQGSPESQTRELLTLDYVCRQNTGLFIQMAALVSPGRYEQRRFWWCANNLDFYTAWLDKLASLPHFDRAIKQLLDNCDTIVSPTEDPDLDLFLANNSPGRLLSDNLYQILTLEEAKLITIVSLHRSIKYSDSTVTVQKFELNKNKVTFRIKRMNKYPSTIRTRLRKYFRIAEAEAELQTIHVDCFVEWWNLTGLRHKSL